MVIKEEKLCQDVEGEPCRNSTSSESDDGSVEFSDAAEEHWHPPPPPPYESRLSVEQSHEISGVQEARRDSCVSDSSSDELNLECEMLEIKVIVEKDERDCRICHLNLESHAHESGVPIVLGCSCKADLAAAHKQCAETWFKIKGNKTCEICGSTAKNVSGTGEADFIESWNDSSNISAAAAPQTETRSFWQGHRFLNFLLACMVFAFVISWLFHFNIPG